MVQHEREIERRVTVPGAFRVENDRAIRSDQQILGAEIAVHERTFARGRSGGNGEQAIVQIRIHVRRLDQIGIEADRMEQRVGREARGDVGASSGRGVQPAEHVADASGARCDDRALAELALPDRIPIRRKPLHREGPLGRVFRQHARGGTRSDVRGEPEPGGFESVPLDGREPVGGDLQLRQGTFDA